MGPEGPIDLCAMQDDWYQDVVPPLIERVLREGTVWSAGSNGEHCTWSLSGRELYVLAERTGLAWWVSQPCVELGRQHVVLCTERTRSMVEDALYAAGAAPPAALDSSLGVPPGWVVFKDVVPQTAVRPTPDADILNALRPLPEIDISLEGGIRLEYGTWLAGFPPRIRVYGDPGHTSQVLIDGQLAHPDRNGDYHVPGADTVGTHTIWCEGTSKSYSLVPFAGSWDSWNAYTFPVAVASARQLSICGPVVQEVSGAPNKGPLLQVPDTHNVVLGPTPGDCFLGIRASDGRGVPRLVSAPFRPIWALPLDPLRCTKGTRILLVGNLIEPTAPATEPRVSRSAHVEKW